MCIPAYCAQPWAPGQALRALLFAFKFRCLFVPSSSSSSSSFSHPIYYLRPSFSLPPSCNSNPGSQSRLFSPPPLYGSCLAFLLGEDFSSQDFQLSSLVDSRRIVLTHAWRSQQFNCWSFHIFANEFKISPRRDLLLDQSAPWIHLVRKSNKQGRCEIICLHQQWPFIFRPKLEVTTEDIWTPDNY